MLNPLEIHTNTEDATRRINRTTNVATNKTTTDSSSNTTYYEDNWVLLKINAAPNAPCLNEPCDVAKLLVNIFGEKSGFKNLPINNDFSKNAIVAWFDSGVSIENAEVQKYIEPLIKITLAELNIENIQTLEGMLFDTDTSLYKDLDLKIKIEELLDNRNFSSTDIFYRMMTLMTYLGHRTIEEDKELNPIKSKRMALKQWTKKIFTKYPNTKASISNLYDLGLSFAIVLAPAKDMINLIVEFRGKQLSSKTLSPFGLPIRENDCKKSRYFLELITPNWSVRGASGDGQTGCNGPGSLPRLVNEKDPRLAEVKNLRKNGPQYPKVGKDNAQDLGKTVRVYVLDTLLSDKLKFKPTSKMKYLWDHNDSKLFQEIALKETNIINKPATFQEGIGITTERACIHEHATTDLLRPVEDACSDLAIDFSNHGPFIADILYREIPERWRNRVELRLVETLNHRAVGSLGVLIRAMQAVWHDIKYGSHADYYVINMSLGITIVDFLEESPSVFSELSTSTFKTYINEMAKGLGIKVSNVQMGVYLRDVLDLLQIFESLFRPLRLAKKGKVIFVVAAGNDALISNEFIKDEIVRQPAAIPARLPSVLGVAAGVSENGSDGPLKPTRYTNKADMRFVLSYYGTQIGMIGSPGVLAFGGDIDAEEWQPLRQRYMVYKETLREPLVLLPYAKNGVIGPYVGPVRARDGTADRAYRSPASGSQPNLCSATLPSSESNVQNGPDKVAEDLMRYVEWSGTSFAAPKVAGRLVAKLLEDDPYIQSVDDALAAITSPQEMLLRDIK